LKIQDYELTKAEFEAEFKGSVYGQTDTLESRKQFLSSFIDRKLVLQDAQAKGLDKERNFLKAIERFWEQTLLKVALDEKTRQVSVDVRVTDAQIQARYDEMAAQGKADKPMADVRDSIREQLTLEKETRLLNEWLDTLRKKTRVSVDEKLLAGQ
jgi:hypothetical protein